MDTTKQPLTPMKLKLEELDYQRKAIDTVVNIIEGQPATDRQSDLMTEFNVVL